MKKKELQQLINKAKIEELDWVRMDAMAEPKVNTYFRNLLHEKVKARIAELQKEIE